MSEEIALFYDFFYMLCPDFLYNFGKLHRIGIKTPSHSVIEPLISHTLTLQCCLIPAS